MSLIIIEDKTEKLGISVTKMSENRYRITVFCVKGSGGGSSTIPGTPGNFVAIGSDNKPVDSGNKSTDFATSSHNHNSTYEALGAVSAHVSALPHYSQLSQLSTDTNNRTVTDSEKSTWNNKQDALGYAPENPTNKDAANGYCGLDSGGKVLIANLPTTLLKYAGVWNATTNTPTLTASDTTKIGKVYNVGTAGTQFGIEFKLGDWAIYNELGLLEKSDNSDDVVSVNGKTGVVVLNTDDLSDSGRANKFVTQSEIDTWNSKETGGAVATHVGEYEHLKQGQMWLDDYSTVIARLSDSVIRVDVGTSAGVDMFSKILLGRLIRWTDSTGATVKFAVITSTQADGYFLNLTIYGNPVVIGDTNWRWSSHLHRITTSQIFIPGELFADAEDVGMEILMPFKNRLIAVSSVLKYIATGGSESLKYNLYANGSALFSADRQHTTNADLMNQLPTTRTMNAGDRITLRITESTGATTKAQGLTVILYYFDYNQMEALT